MVRILIFILAFNAFIIPASAQSVCNMPMDISSASAEMMKSSNMADHSMSGEDMSCCSVECLSECTYYFSPFSILTESATIQKVLVLREVVIASAPLSDLVLPVNTPPPLA